MKRGLIFKQIIIIAAIAIGGLMVFILFHFFNSLAYEPNPTHAALAEKSSRLFNSYFNGNLSADDIAQIIQGAINEDTPPRWINHFYDPTTGQGWTSERMGQLPPNVVRAISELALSTEEAVAAPDWAQNQSLQAKYKYYEGNHTFQKAIYDYVNGDKKEAYISLGHILHLIEDMAVPAHTRQDTHYQAAGDPGEPYEQWAKNNTDLSHLNNFNPKSESLNCQNLNDCFLKVAKYSNENFFSEDTTSGQYQLPRVATVVDKGGDYAFGYNDKNVLYKIIFKPGTKKVEKITVEDPLVHSSYWQLLSKQAVLGGAEIIKLFFDEVAKAQNDKSRLEPPPAEPVSFFGNLYTGLAALSSSGNLAVFSPYGEWEKIKAVLGRATTGLTSLFSGISGTIVQKEPAALSPAQTGEAPEQIVPSASPSPTPTKVVAIQPPAKVGLPSNTVAAVEKTGSGAGGSIVEQISPKNAEIPSLIIEEKNPSQAILSSPSPTPASFIPGIAGPPPSAVSTADTTLPNTDITSQPSSPVASTTAVFIFTSSESDSTFECQLDGVAFSICASPKEYSSLSDGSHIFKVKAVDSAGNQDSTPAEYSWVIDTTAPVISNISSTASRHSAVISWISWELGIFQIEYGTTTGHGLVSATTTLNDLTLGSLLPAAAYHFRLLAQDNLGNATSTADNTFTTTAWAENVVISEIQLSGGVASTTDEFVELYNPTNSDINLADWRLTKKTASGMTTENLLTSFPAKTIPAHGYFLITHPTGYDGGVPADAVYSTTASMADNNTMILYSDAGHTIVDMIGFGSASSSETATIGNPTAHQSVERKATATSTAGLLVNGSHQWQGNAYDSDDNSNDFVLQNNPNPQNSLMLIEPRNSLPNLMTTSSWPTWQKNLARTGLSSATPLATSTLKVKWTATTTTVTDSFVSRPVLDDQGNIYIGRTTGLAKYSSSGNLLWLYATSTAVSTPLLASDNTIFFRGSGGLYALSPDGRLKWKYPLAGSAGQNAALAILSDGTIITQFGEKVYAINQDATLKWPLPFNPGRAMQNSNSITAPVIDSSDNIYIAIDNYLYAVSAGGSFLWEKYTGLYSNSALALGSDDILYLGIRTAQSQGGLYALNKTDGSTLWVKTPGYNDQAELAPAIDNSGQVYAIMFYYGGIAKLEAYLATSTPSWTSVLGSTSLAAPIITQDGKIYLADQKTIKVFDGGTGQLLADFTSPNDDYLFSFFGAIGPDGTIYTANSTRLYAMGN